MRIDFEHLLDKEIRNFKNLDEVAELRYPTGCVDMTKREILAKLCEMEFLQNATWSHKFLDELENEYINMNAAELAKILSQELTTIFDWDERAYMIMIGETQLY